jgi:hypothetical protein
MVTITQPSNLRPVDGHHLTHTGNMNRPQRQDDDKDSKGRTKEKREQEYKRSAMVRLLRRHPSSGLAEHWDKLTIEKEKRESPLHV